MTLYVPVIGIYIALNYHINMMSYLVILRISDFDDCCHKKKRNDCWHNTDTRWQQHDNGIFYDGSFYDGIFCESIFQD